jgi:hypothetical protein
MEMATKIFIVVMNVMVRPNMMTRNKRNDPARANLETAPAKGMSATKSSLPWLPWSCSQMGNCEAVPAWCILTEEKQEEYIR